MHFEEDAAGKKALLFSYRLYLLPNGDLKSAVSNVEPDKLAQFMLSEMGQEANEYVNQLKSAVSFLISEMAAVDDALGKHIGALA